MASNRLRRRLVVRYYRTIYKIAYLWFCFKCATYKRHLYPKTFKELEDGTIVERKSKR